MGKIKEELDKNALLVVRVVEPPLAPAGTIGFQFGTMEQDSVKEIEVPIRGSVMSHTLSYLYLKQWADENPGWEPSEFILDMKKFFGENCPLYKEEGIDSEDTIKALKRTMSILDAAWPVESQFVRGSITGAKTALFAVFPFEKLGISVYEDAADMLRTHYFTAMSAPGHFVSRRGTHGEEEIEVLAVKVPFSLIRNPNRFRQVMEKKLREKWKKDHPNE